MECEKLCILCLELWIRLVWNFIYVIVILGGLWWGKLLEVGGLYRGYGGFIEVERCWGGFRMGVVNGEWGGKLE